MPPKLSSIQKNSDQVRFSVFSVLASIAMHFDRKGEKHLKAEEKYEKTETRMQNYWTQCAMVLRLETRQTRNGSVTLLSQTSI